MKKGGLGMAQYRLNIRFWESDLQSIEAMQSGISRTLHWFKKGAPPGIAGSMRLPE